MEKKEPKTMIWTFYISTPEGHPIQLLRKQLDIQV